MTRFSLSSIADKRTKKGLRKQIISIFSIISDEKGPHVEIIASPYQCESLFNAKEISILYTTVSMLEVKEMLIGELKLLFELFEFKMSDGRPSKKIIVTVCGCDANSEQVRKIIHNMIHSSNAAIKNLETLLER
ncbi:MAG: hypothetical protein U9O98_08675 [Asgard group archaeon]|nr:hypothetical protein [Asgard group archaeon]